MYIIIIHNDIKWPILCHNSQTQITSLTFANYHHIMCSAKLAEILWYDYCFRVCYYFFKQGNSLELIFSLSVGTLSRIGESILKYTKEKENEKRERARGEKKHRGESFKWWSCGQCTGSSNTRSVCLVPSLFGCPWSRYWQRNGDTTKEPHCTPVQAMEAW